MRTVAPTGNQGIWLAGVAYLIASSSTFQTLTGAAGSAAAALAHVATIGDDSEGSGSTRPRAIVYPCEGFSLRKIALQRFRLRFACDVSFEIAPSSLIEAESPNEDRWWDESIVFMNTIDGILADLWALQGTGSGYVSGQSHVALDETELTEIGTGEEEVRAEGQEGETATYFLASVFRFTGAG